MPEFKNPTLQSYTPNPTLQVQVAIKLIVSATLPQKTDSSSLPSSLVSWAIDLLNCDVRAFMSMTILFLMVFVNSADFQGADPEQFSFKWQIYLRMAVCGIAGIYALCFIQDFIGQVQKFPGAIALLYASWALISVPFAIDIKYSAVSAVSLWSAVLFVPVAIHQAGKYRFIVAALIGTLLYTAISWFLFIVFPEIGMWKEFLGDGETLERMGGLGHPNALGFFVSGAFVLAMILWHDKRIRWFEAVAITILWLATIYFCLSRTSFIIAGFSAMAIFGHRIFTYRGVATFFGGAIAVGIVVLGLAFSGALDDWIRDSMLAVSKSGETSEITTATGRSDIWEYAIKQVQLRPLTGCGYGCARFTMVEHSYHAHNIVLNAGIMTGVVGMLLVAWMLLAMAIRLFNRPDAYLRGIIVLFLIGGTVESLIYDPCPTLQAILFFSVLFWPTPEPDQSNADKETPLTAA